MRTSPSCRRRASRLAHAAPSSPAPVRTTRPPLLLVLVLLLVPVPVPVLVPVLVLVPARAAAVAAAEAAVWPSDCFPNNSHVGHGWNDSAAKFRAAYGLMDQGHDNLTRPDFDGCDHAFACTLGLLLYP